METVAALGAVCRPQVPPEQLRDVVAAADEAGLAQLWFWEDCFWQSGIASAAAALAWTRRLRVGVGLLPVPLRNVAITAMEMATLHRLFPGRVDIGVGHGVQEWMAQVGARVDSPVTLLREHLAALRALLRGERVTVDGRYVRLDGVALDWPPPSAPAILVGATGPRSLRLSGEVADGTILTAETPPDGLRRARRLIDEGRRAGGRTGEHLLVVYLLAATGPDAAERLAGERRRQGYDGIPEVGVASDARVVADAVRRWADAGADMVVLQPTSDEPDPVGFVRFAAGEVQPLVHNGPKDHGGPEDWEKLAEKLAPQSIAAGDPTGWFDRLYAAGAAGEVPMPWNRATPHPLLVEWARARDLAGGGKRAVVVGCGLGADAEYVARLGYHTMAFDVAETAIRVARQRHPGTPVEYVVADLLRPPAAWSKAFDLVVEIITVQALPEPSRRSAIVNIGRLVAPGGTLVVIAAVAGASGAAVAGPPWPLTRDDIDAFATDGLRPVRVEQVSDPRLPSELRWRAEFHRPI